MTTFVRCSSSPSSTPSSRFPTRATALRGFLSIVRSDHAARHASRNPRSHPQPGSWLSPPPRPTWGCMAIAQRRSIPSDVAYLRACVVDLVRLSCAELSFNAHHLALNVPVALTEALSNAILRGNHESPEKRVRVHAAVDTLRLVVEVSDEGTPFDLDADTVDATSAENLEREDGRGLFLMRKLMDDVHADIYRRRHCEWKRQRGATYAESRMGELGEVLAAFHEATACDVAVWRRDSAAAVPRFVAGTDARRATSARMAGRRRDR